MPIEVRVPALGESVVEATVGQWRKQPGDTVAAGDALVELETDKVNVEVAADNAGVLAEIAKPEGATVAPGDVLAVLNEAGAATEARPHPSPLPTSPGEGGGRPSPQPAPAAAGEGAWAGGSQPAASGTPPLPATPGEGQGEGISHADGVATSPAARQIAAEHGVDLSRIPGSGPRGRITREDVVGAVTRPPAAGEAAATPPTTPTPTVSQPPTTDDRRPTTGDDRRPAPEPARREERIRMTRRRQVIAQRLVEAQHTAAMLTTFNEIDMSAVMELRKRRREAFQKRHGVGLGFMSFFTKAVVGALKAQPLLNAEIQGDEIVVKHYYDIGIAVGAAQGLVVPVVRDADRKTFAQIEREIGELAERARTNTLKLEELQGGTFTITNGGIFGSLMSTPILNPPQVGILGMHKIEERPVAVGGQVVIRPMMYVALSYDHRIVDGREAVTFLVRVKELVEDPETLLLEG